MKIQKTFFTQKSKSDQKRLRLAITLGDPAGIGPEVLLKALADPEIAINCELTVIGTRSLLQNTYTHLRQQALNNGDELVDPDQLTILDIGLEASIQRQIAIGVGNAASGEASFSYLERE